MTDTNDKEIQKRIDLIVDEIGWNLSFIKKTGLFQIFADIVKVDCDWLINLLDRIYYDADPLNEEFWQEVPNNVNQDGIMNFCKAFVSIFKKQTKNELIIQEGKNKCFGCNVLIEHDTFCNTCIEHRELIEEFFSSINTPSLFARKTPDLAVFINYHRTHYLDRLFRNENNLNNEKVFIEIILNETLVHRKILEESHNRTRMRIDLDNSVFHTFTDEEIKINTNANINLCIKWVEMEDRNYLQTISGYFIQPNQ